MSWPRYRLTRPRRPIDLPTTQRPTALCWVESSDYDEDGRVHLEGPPELVERIRTALAMSYGDRARPLDLEEGFSPRDLACAMSGRALVPFEPCEV